jgi:integrase
VAEKLFRVRGFVVDPRTGRRREIDRVIEVSSVHEAKRARAELLLKEEQAVEPVTRVRVGEYARSWMRSKALKLDGATARTYADALEQHILPRLGDLFYDAVTGRDVQAWVDDAILNGWKTRRGVNKRYSPWSVHAWFRVFRAMTRDAMHELGLERDPTLRVSFPAAEEKIDANCLEPDELAAFLSAMRAEFPHHWGLSVLLAYTGLRFCHASALRWEDWDRDRGLIRVLRKQVRGKVAPVTRKKQAPREIPVEPELAAALDEHRAMLLADQAPGLAEGWMFPSSAGTLRVPNSLYKAWRRCMEVTGIERRFTVHGMRYTFTDLVRRANVDAVVRRALTGHVTERMQRHY